MGINLNPSKILNAFQALAPAMGPAAGPLAAIIKGIAGSGKLGNVRMTLGQLQQGPFSQASGAAHTLPSPRPQAFSPTVINIQITQNPMGALQQGRPGAQGANQAQGASSNPMQQIVELLKKLLESLTGGAQGAQGSGSTAPSSGGTSGTGGTGGTPTQGKGIADASTSSMDSMVSKVGGKIDDMFAQAEKLMASDKPSDQLKAQRMMQQANRMFEMMSKMIEDIGKKATSTLKRSSYQPA